MRTQEREPSVVAALLLVILTAGCAADRADTASESQKESTDATWSDAGIEEKIWGGNGIATRVGVVKIGGDGGVPCTGIVINNNTVLSAAHCFSNLTPGQTTTQSAGIVYKKADGSHICISGGPVKWVSSTTTEGWVCENGGANYQFTLKSDWDPSLPIDPADDIAVLKKTSGNFTGLTNSDFSLIYLGSFSSESRLEVYGYGLNSHSTTGAGTLRSGSAAIAWFIKSHFALTNVGTRMCKGDSGGPAFIYVNKTLPEVQAVGLLSGGPMQNNVCIDGDGEAKYVRLSDEIGFIRTYSGAACPAVTSARNGRTVARCF